MSDVKVIKRPKKDKEISERLENEAALAVAWEIKKRAEKEVQDYINSNDFKSLVEMMVKLIMYYYITVYNILK